MTLDQVLQGSRDEEIFLPQSQLAPGWALVIRIQELANRFGARFFSDCADIVAGIENVEFERVGRTRRPQPQRIDLLAAPTDDRGIVGNSLHRFGGMPDRAVASL